MATYKEIKGVTVQTKDEDPVLNVGSWSSGGTANTARKQLSGAGIQTAGLVFGGRQSPSAGYDQTEQYDGSSWTEVNDLNTARRGMAGIGLYNAALSASGWVTTALANNESWDGTNWTEVGDVNTARQTAASSGTQTAAIIYGGYDASSPHHTAVMEQWNGSSWTETTDLNTARNGLTGSPAGTTTAALAVLGSQSGTLVSNVEQWNGSAWTEVSEANTNRQDHSASGTYTANLIFSGNTGSVSALTENWDGTSWTEVADLSTARDSGSGFGASNEVGLMGLGDTGSAVGATEEFSFPPPTAAILTEGSIFLSGGTTLKGFGKAAGIPAATFASGGSLNTARGYHGGAGTDHEALLAFGGTTGTAVNNVEQYNGSSWSEVAEINTTRANVTGFGSSTAAIAGNGSTPDKSQVESWNGSAWTEIAELNTSRSDSASAGIQTSGMVATGTPVPGNPALQPGGTSTVTETWNGTSWTEVGDTNTKRLQAGMAVSGTTSAGIIAAGEDGPGSRTVNAETWNGTSWTEVSNISQQRGTIYNFMGHSTSANMAGGYSGTARVANNEHWNGSSWTEINDLSTARNAAFGAGSAVNGAVFGGDTGDYQSATEEFIADNALSTVTVSQT